VLLSSRAKATLDNDEVSDNERHQPGYSYHGVNMKAHPIDLVPEVASYAEELATRYNLPRWDIGVDMIAYKDGGDSIGWHADDTQGESVVVCVVVDAPDRFVYVPNEQNNWVTVMKKFNCLLPKEMAMTWMVTCKRATNIVFQRN
jgi:hypothetical protein